MRVFWGIFKYTLLKFLNSPALLLVFLIGLIVLTITSIYTGDMNFVDAYPYYQMFNFFLALVLGAGIIGGEFSHGHIELIFTKPIKREIFFLYKYFSAFLCSFFLILISIMLSLLLFIFLKLFIIQDLSFSFPAFLKTFLYMFLNQITLLSLLFFLSSLTSGSQNSLFLLFGTFFFSFFTRFISVRFPSLAKQITLLSDLLSPFKVDVLRGHDFSFFSFLFHWIIYPLSLLLMGILIVNKKEITK